MNDVEHFEYLIQEVLKDATLSEKEVIDEIVLLMNQLDGVKNLVMSYAFQRKAFIQMPVLKVLEK
ncbi:MAG: hypothetical protein F6J86_05405 [Symploca sp. SIO1B1]|nr:hypothetical protein [Symploca sp. SIO1B1]